MKVIVAYKKYHDLSILEVIPEVYRIDDNIKPEDALRKMWEDFYNEVIAENFCGEINDPLDTDNCWIEYDVAVITWADGDTKEFYIVDVIDKY